MVMIN